jgi:predicted CoA-binding protein
VNPPDAALHDLLAASRTIAVVGHSDKPYRDSYGVAQYLRQVGYRVYAVNPNLRTVAGDTAYPNLRQLPERIDIVDVFRRAEHLSQIVEDAIAIGARAVWGQFGVVDPAAAERAQAAGLVVVMDRCIKVEHRRLGMPRRVI